MENRIKQLSKTCNYYITTKENSLPYQNSLALHTNQNPKDIISNREKISLSSQPLEFMVANQVHSNSVVVIDEKLSKGWSEESSAIKSCDGLITNQKGVVLTILTADCVPILLYDKSREVISGLHAGWRGTKLEIVKIAILKMIKEFGTNPKDISVFIAPSIRGCCYEVGIDVSQEFEEYREYCIPTNNKYMLDLSAINRVQLLDMGVESENIEISSSCTACESDKFFSYRKEGGCDGRFMSIIWMNR
ncbi:MAG: peptidoglycan editing factor PgeF [Sulfurovum sp.]